MSSKHLWNTPGTLWYVKKFEKIILIRDKTAWILPNNFNLRQKCMPISIPAPDIWDDWVIYQHPRSSPGHRTSQWCVAHSSKRSSPFAFGRWSRSQSSKVAAPFLYTNSKAKFIASQAPGVILAYQPKASNPKTTHQDMTICRILHFYVHTHGPEWRIHLQFFPILGQDLRWKKTKV